MKTTRNLLGRTLIAFALIATGQVLLFSTLSSNPATTSSAETPADHASMSAAFPLGQAQFARRTALASAVGS